MNTNFIFVRHGQSCNNAQRALRYTTFLDAKLLKSILNFNDPHLSQLGVESSTNNGKVIENIFKNIYKFNPRLKIDKINLIGCSPLIRSMETAYFMSRTWENPPDTIYVFPILRELNESAVDPYTIDSKKRLDLVPGYYMNNIDEQKEYLRKIGILDFFDFSMVESELELRKEPGNIQQFIEWFNDSISVEEPLESLNVFVVTHAGVLHQFAKEGFVNNSGFILNTTLGENIRYNILESMSKYLPTYFFKSYNDSKYNLDYYCPSDRCGSLCKLSNNPKLKTPTFN
jgi:hypothetical protein